MLEEIDLPKISTHIEDSKFVLDGAADDIKKALSSDQEFGDDIY